MSSFPLSCNFSVRIHVKFTRLNEIEAMYESPRANVKDERTFMCTRDPSLRCLYFVYARKIYVRTQVKITRQWKSTLGMVTRKRKS